MLSGTDAQRLREALRAVPYTVGDVQELLGSEAHDALRRNETTPARLATTGDSGLATLTRLFALQLAVSQDAADRVFPGSVDAMCDGGVLERSAGEVRARVDVAPYGDETHDWWVVSDLTPGLDGADPRVGPEHVLGISEASSSLAQLTVREHAGSALDLGAGCGVQSLHLATHSDTVVGTDVNPRALEMYRLTAALNGVSPEVRDGSLFAPVTGERYDLIVSNPPFVISPGTARRLVYRDAGLPGDEVVSRLVTQAPWHLQPGGWCQILANWQHSADEAWEERVTGWIEQTGCDAWVMQREVADLPRYVEMWLADEGLHGHPDYVRRYDEWLRWFAAQGIEAVGFGWVCLRNAGRARPVVRVEHWPYEITPPVGPALVSWAARTDAFADLGDEAVLASRLRQSGGVVEEAFGRPGATDPEAIVVRLADGVRRARQVDTVEAGLIGASDGELSVAQILDALGTLLERDSGEMRATYAATVRELVAEGFLEPAD